MSCWIGTVDERPNLERVLGEMNQDAYFAEF